MRLLGSTTQHLGVPWHFWRVESGQGLLVPKLRAGPGGQGGQDAAEEAGRNGAAARTRSYAHCSLEGMGANNN